MTLGLSFGPPCHHRRRTQLPHNTWSSIGSFSQFTRPSLPLEDLDNSGHLLGCDVTHPPSRHRVTVLSSISPKSDPSPDFESKMCNRLRNDRRNAVSNVYLPAALRWRSAVGLRYVLQCLQDVAGDEQGLTVHLGGGTGKKTVFLQSSGDLDH